MLQVHRLEGDLLIVTTSVAEQHALEIPPKREFATMFAALLIVSGTSGHHGEGELLKSDAINWEVYIVASIFPAKQSDI